MKINDLKRNENNPRGIKPERLRKLISSIIEFPQMMALRPLVYNGANAVLGGNMRLEAVKGIQKMGPDEVKKILEEKKKPENFKLLAPLFSGDMPAGWTVSAAILTPEQEKRFIIADNVEYGEWDWDMLANEWEARELNEWGLGAWEIDESDEIELPQSHYNGPVSGDAGGTSLDNFTPETQPKQSIAAVNENDIRKGAESIHNTINSTLDTVKIVCPHCNKEFEIEKKEVL